MTTPTYITIGKYSFTAKTEEYTTVWCWVVTDCIQKDMPASHMKRKLDVVSRVYYLWRHRIAVEPVLLAQFIEIAKYVPLKQCDCLTPYRLHFMNTEHNQGRRMTAFGEALRTRAESEDSNRAVFPSDNVRCDRVKDSKKVMTLADVAAAAGGAQPVQHLTTTYKDDAERSAMERIVEEATHVDEPEDAEKKE